MRTTLDIDAHLLKRLRAEAARRGVPFKEVVAGALRRGLDSAAAEAKPAPIALPTYHLGKPLFNIDKANQLVAELEDEEFIRKFMRPK